MCLLTTRRIHATNGVAWTMTDSFDSRDNFLSDTPQTDAPSDFSSVADHDSFSSPASAIMHSLAAQAADTAPVVAEPALPEVPNGFVVLGLAPELLQAVADMGFTQPTIVQQRVVPLALGTATNGKDAGKDAGKDSKKFIDLMVSSQTGSGKTAAFLLPVLHTLLAQEQAADAAEKAEFKRLADEAVARGETAPKRPKRKDPTNTRNFKPLRFRGGV